MVRTLSNKEIENCSTYNIHSLVLIFDMFKESLSEYLPIYIENPTYSKQPNMNTSK